MGGLLIDSAAEITQGVELAILNYLTGGLASLPTVAVMSFGAGAEQARTAGADLDQQAAYGLASAITDIASKKLMNVATPFRYAFGPGILDEAVSELVGKLGDTKTGRIVLSALSEGGEALAQSIVLPILQRATYDPMAAFDLGDTMYQTAIGTITGAFGGGFDALTLPDPFLTGFYGDDLAEIQDTITAENLIQYVQEHAAHPDLSAQSLEAELQQPKTDRNSDPVFKLDDLNKIFNEILSSTEKTYFSDPDSIKNSLMHILDSSSGLKDNIAMLQYYAENTDFVLSPKLSCPIAYSATYDIIRYNPNLGFLDGVDMEGVLAHELAHRADYLMYDVKKNLQWQSAIEALTQSLNLRGKEIESLFRNNKKYNNPYLSDIISAIFRDSIDLPLGHDEDYWAIPGRREEEIFANLCAMNALQSLEEQEFYPLIAPLYLIWKEIMKG